MHTLGGRAADDEGFSFCFFSFHSRCLQRLGFLSVSVGFFPSFLTLGVHIICARMYRYRLGFSFDLFGTAFNWMTTAHTAAATAKMPTDIGSLVVLITLAHSFPPTIAGQLCRRNCIETGAGTVRFWNIIIMMLG